MDNRVLTLEDWADALEWGKVDIFVEINTRAGKLPEVVVVTDEQKVLSKAR